MNYEVTNLKNQHEQRRRRAPILWLLSLMMLVPPGMVARVSATPAWDSPLTQSVTVNTFRNPSTLSAQYNRFLYATNPDDLTPSSDAHGGNPNRVGVHRSSLGTNAVRIGDGGHLVWTDQDMEIPSIGSPVKFSRIWRGTVTSYDGPLGNRWDFNWNRRFEPLGADMVFYDMGRREVYVDGTSTYAYDSPAGRYDTLDFNGDGDLVRTDRGGFAEHYQVTTGGWYALAKTVDRNGNEVHYARTLDGQLFQVVSPLGWYAFISYDSAGRIDIISDSENREWHYDYDAAGNLESVRSPVYDHPTDNGHDVLAGRVDQYGYVGGELAYIYQPGDGAPTWVFEYDLLGRVEAQHEADNETTFEYDTGKVTVTHPSQDRTVYDINAAGRIASSTYLDQSPTETTSWTYNSDGEVTVVTMADQSSVEYQHDSKGRVVSVEHHSGPSDATPLTWEYEYDVLSELTLVRDAEGEEWEYDYDDAGNLTKKAAPAVSLPAGIATDDLNGNGTFDGTIIEAWSYGSYGELMSHTDPSGVVTSFTYHETDGGGDGSSPIAPIVVHTVSVGGFVSLPGVLTATSEIDEYTNITKWTEPGGAVAEHEFNVFGEMIGTTGPAGLEERYYSDSKGNLTRIATSSDVSLGVDWAVTDMHYDAANRLTHSEYDLDATERLESRRWYDGTGRLTRTLEASGRESLLGYDGAGRLTSRVAVGDTYNRETLYERDELGNVTKQRIARDATYDETALLYDGYGRVTEITDPEGHYSRKGYDRNGRVLVSQWFEVSGALLREVVVERDAMGRVHHAATRAERSSGALIDDGWQDRYVHHDESGRVLKVTGDECSCSLAERSYDDLGRLTWQGDALDGALQNTLSIEYDAAGYIGALTRTDASQDTGIEPSKVVILRSLRDQAGRVTRVEDGSGSMVHEMEYGDRGQVTVARDGASRETHLEYNQRLWLVAEEVGGLERIEHVHDTANRTKLFRAGAPGGVIQETEYRYDKLGQMTYTGFPDGTVATISHDRAGNVTHRGTASGMADYVLDGNGRALSVSYVPAAGVIGVQSAAYSYDGVGRVASISTIEQGGFETSVDLAYSTLGAFDSETLTIDDWAQGAGRTLHVDRDIAGESAKLTLPVSGHEIVHERDKLGRMTRIVREGESVRETSYSGGRPISVVFPESSIDYLYDSRGRLTMGTHRDAGGLPLAKLEYQLDGFGRLTGQGREFFRHDTHAPLGGWANEGTQLLYDDAGRLVTTLSGVGAAFLGSPIATNVTNGDYAGPFKTYTYDGVGNRVAASTDGVGATYTIDSASNELLADSANSYTYADAGGLEDVVPGATYTYDFLGRVARCVVSGKDFRYRYDGLGRLVQRDQYQVGHGGVGFGGGGGVFVRFYYHGRDVVEQVRLLGGNELPRKEFVYGDRGGELVAYYDTKPAAEVAYSLHLGPIDSPLFCVDANGDVAESYRYDEYGACTILDGNYAALSTVKSPIGLPYRFAGSRVLHGPSVFDAQVLDMRWRAYRCSGGRFQQRDPLGYVDGGNLYEYVRGDPVNYTDPLGLEGTLGHISEIAQWDAIIRNHVRGDLDRYYTMGPGAITATELAVAIAVGKAYDAQGRAGGLVSDTTEDRPGVHEGAATEAVRHCVWQCEMTVSPAVGPELAKKLGDVHEEAKSDDPLDEARDQHNNAAGRKLAEDVKAGLFDNCEDACRYQIELYNERRGGLLHVGWESAENEGQTATDADDRGTPLVSQPTDPSEMLDQIGMLEPMGFPAY